MPPTLAAVHPRLPPGSAFSGLTAVRLYDLAVAPREVVSATVPLGFGNARLRGVEVRRSQLLPGDVVRRQGWPVTSIERTLCDLALELPLVDATVITDMALHAGLCTIPQLARWIASRRGRPGTALLRRVLQLAEPAAESPMESRLRLLLVLGRLPRPTAQWEVRDDSGHLLGRVDLAYPAARLCIEFDGGTHRDRLVSDNRRQNRLVEAGCTVLRFTTPDVLHSPHQVVAQVRAELKRLNAIARRRDSETPRLNAIAGRGAPG